MAAFRTEEDDMLWLLSVSPAADYPEDCHVSSTVGLRIFRVRARVPADHRQLPQPACRQRKGQGIPSLILNEGMTYG